MENYVKREIDIYGNIVYYNSVFDLHRLDGPAIIWHNGGCMWRINNVPYIKTKHNKLVLFYMLEPQRIVLNPINAK